MRKGGFVMVKQKKKSDEKSDVPEAVNEVLQKKLKLLYEHIDAI